MLRICATASEMLTVRSNSRKATAGLESKNAKAPLPTNANLVRILRHRQSKAFTERRHAIKIEAEFIPGAQRRHLLRISPCGREFEENLFEPARGNDRASTVFISSTLDYIYR